MHRSALGLAVSFLLALVVACAPAAPSPTPPPPKPTEAPKPAPQPTPAPAKPAAPPTAAPAKPTEAPRPAAKPEDLKIPRPSGALTLKVGHPSTISFYDLPTQITHERLKADGWTIESVQFTRTDLNTQALSQGTVQLAISQLLDPLRVIERGGKIAWLMENNGGEFVMIAKNEIKDCKELEGKRFAIHGDTATTSLATKKYLENDCKVKANILVIPGGENRIVALRNDQIDATLVQLADWLNLDAQTPGRFHVIPTGGLYNISGAGLWANVEWLDKNREVATAYVAETLKTFRMIHANPKLLEEAVSKYVPDTPKEAIPRAIQAYREVIGAWPQNGGTPQMLDLAINFFTPLGELKPGLESAKLVRGDVLENALAMVGKVPSSR